MRGYIGSVDSSGVLRRAPHRWGSSTAAPSTGTSGQHTNQGCCRVLPSAERCSKVHSNVSSFMATTKIPIPLLVPCSGWCAWGLQPYVVCVGVLDVHDAEDGAGYDKGIDNCGTCGEDFPPMMPLGLARKRQLSREELSRVEPLADEARELLKRSVQIAGGSVKSQFAMTSARISGATSERDAAARDARWSCSTTEESPS